MYEELHELLANLAIAFVIFHVVYLLSSKRKLAGDMLNGTGEISIKELANEVLR